MPWKLILAIVILAIIIGLIGFNWGYSSNVSLGFYVFEEVPIIITIGISFLGGALFAIPYAIRTSRQIKQRQSKKLEQKLSKQTNQESNANSTRTRNGKSKGKSKKDRGNTENSTPLPDVPPESK